MPLRRTLDAFRRRPLYSCAVGLFWGTAGPIFVNDNLVEITFVEGESMSPTLSRTYHETGARDAVMWNKRFQVSNLQRGDVIHFMNPCKPEGFAVKRVVALEGDTVILDRRRRPERTEGPEMRETRAWDAWKGRAVVPPGHMWVEGDNARSSHDSNYYGPISMSLVEGRAVAVVNPSKFWTKPWEGYKSRTRVIESGSEGKDWADGLPVELAEIGEPHLPP